MADNTFEPRESEFLFVYGTLRRGFPLNHILRKLGAKFLHHGRIAGVLFDLGRFPGARPATMNVGWVQGELFKLQRPEQDLQVLDTVEGFDASAPECSKFVRALTDVIMPGNGRMRAWIYWWGSRSSHRPRITGGDYADWLTDRRPSR